MAASDDTTRRTEAERVRQLAASEARAFTATAVTMLLGVLAEAEATEQHRRDPPSLPEGDHASAVHAQPGAVTHERDPAGPAAHDSAPAEHHGDAGLVDPASPATAVHATAAPETPEIVAGAHSPVPTEAGPAPAGEPSLSVAHGMTFAEHVATGAEGPLQTGSAVAATADPQPLAQLSETITGLVDNSLATISHTLANLTASVGQLTASLSNTVSHLTDGLIGTATTLLHETPLTAPVDTVLTDLLGTHSATTDPSQTTAHSVPLLDTAGVIPVAPLHPMPLQLGFLGQPTTDGHDTHDGAFSALGIHHF